ncbi:SAVED domain-containing protein [Runella zeae]|uniref:SAVED domain-containing protein n=1 Tax=Runella zeae TaxID=94255 RepID=UPI0003F83F58|nr:SAVED domain-containing protein [Runella zeae]
MKDEVQKKKKNRKEIPEKVVNLLWARSAGRCQYEGCNEMLSRDILTKRNYNAAYIAHIIAAEPDGPRGDEILSPKHCQDFDNLMLMCDKHHRLIDKIEVVSHPVERLVAMKRRHETLIERLTDFKDKTESEILLFGANIGNQKVLLTYNDAFDTISEKYYPSSNYGVELGLLNSGVIDYREEFWGMEEANLRANFGDKIKQKLEKGTIKHLSVFGLAPQPLLILLGSLLGDLHPTEVYQLHREPKTWKWLNEPDEVTFEVFKPQNSYPTVALVFALSATITEDRIVSVLGEECSIWTFTVNKPNNDFLRNREQLARFRTELRLLLNEIKAYHGQNNLIHVFPAMPNAMAIELGRVRMPKADLPMLVYDQNFQNPARGFYPTIKID